MERYASRQFFEKLKIDIRNHNNVYIKDRLHLDLVFAVTATIHRYKYIYIYTHVYIYLLSYIINMLWQFPEIIFLPLKKNLAVVYIKK